MKKMLFFCGIALMVTECWGTVPKFQDKELAEAMNIVRHKIDAFKNDEVLKALQAEQAKLLEQIKIEKDVRALARLNKYQNTVTHKITTYPMNKKMALEKLQEALESLEFVLYVINPFEFQAMA